MLRRVKKKNQDGIYASSYFLYFFICYIIDRKKQIKKHGEFYSDDKWMPTLNGVNNLSYKTSIETGTSYTSAKFPTRVQFYVDNALRKI